VPDTGLPHTLIEECEAPGQPWLTSIDLLVYGPRLLPAPHFIYRNSDAGHAQIPRAEYRLLTNRAEEQSAASRSAKEGRSP
jgi:hypothetical protein